MKTENGYVYFMYNPYTGLPDSDDETSSNRPKRLYRKHTHKGLIFTFSVTHYVWFLLTFHVKNLH